MRIFNELKGEKYNELTVAYEKFLPAYFGKLGEAYKIYPEALENEEYKLYVDYNKWPIRKLEYSFVINKMQEALFQGAKVLDAGCGVSSMPFLWNELGGDVTAVDLDQKSIDLMNKFDRDAFFGEDRHIETNVCDIMKLPYADETFDVVVTVSVLEHLPYPNYLLAVSELYRVLKKGGTLVCTCDLKAEQDTKRRAVGAFSAEDIKKIMAEFEGELVDEDLDVKKLAITSEEIEHFWLQHYYEGIGYEGNRGYVAIGFHIKKCKNEDKKVKLLKYNEMIEELICYEDAYMEKENELLKVNKYAKQKTEENFKLLEDLRKTEAESKKRLEDLQKTEAESEKRLEDLQKAEAESQNRLEDLQKAEAESQERLRDLQKAEAESKERLESLQKAEAEKQEYLGALHKVSEESQERLLNLEKVSKENQQLLDDLNKTILEKQKCEEAVKIISDESEKRLAALEKVTLESEKRLEAINYLHAQLENKNN